MLVSAVAFWRIILAVHIAAVVVGFGVTFAYPLIVALGTRMDPRSMPLFHQVRQQIGQRLINPGLGVVLIAGIYLASDLHQWKAFYVQWGLAVAIVLGGLEGGFMIRTEAKLAEIARRDVAAAGTGAVQWSPEYRALAGRVQAVGAVMSLLVLITVYLMSVRAGA